MLLFEYSKTVESKPVKTGDQLYSDTFPWGESSLV